MGLRRKSFCSLAATMFLLAIAASSNAQPTFLFAWGSQGAGPGQFDRPWGLAVDREGYVFVADQNNYRIQKFTTDGTFVSEWGGHGTGPGQLIGPLGITLGPEGHLYVVEHGNHRVSKFTRDGAFVGMWGTGMLTYPVAICVDPAGNVYVSQLGPLIQKFTPSGVPLGSWNADGMYLPYGLVSDPSGNILVADHDGGPIQKYTNTGTFLGYIGLPGSGSMPGQFRGPHGMCFDDHGDLFIADTDNDRVQQFDASGNFRTMWGITGSLPGQFIQPVDVACDTLGRIFVSDYSNFRIQVFQYQSPPPPPLSNAPALTAVRDVLDDQGGRVFVTWLPSRLDMAGVSAITGYRVWRRIHPAATLAQVAAPMADAGARDAKVLRQTGSEGVTVTYWEALVDLPAQQLEGYGYTASTTQDSMRRSNPYTAFFVTALTANPTVFYSSNVDSGYSVDNLPPRRPYNLAGAITAAGYALAWDPADPALDPDVLEYSVYRGSTSDFPMDSRHLLGMPVDPEYVDSDASGAHFYKVTATDLHGNTSLAAMLDPVTPVGAPKGSFQFALRGATPNPARSTGVMIAFSLPNESTAMLELFDTTGRRVVERTVVTHGAGSHVVNVAEGRALRPGHYLVRLTQGVQSLYAKVVITP